MQNPQSRGTESSTVAALDPDLIGIVTAWPRLAESIRRDILAMIASQ